MRVTPAGSKAYIFYKKVLGKPTRITLGAVAGMALPDARRAVQQLNGKAAAGTDVAEERKEAKRKGVTLNELYESWCKGAKGLKSLKADQGRWKNYLEAIGRKQAVDVTNADLQRVIDRIGADTPRTANLCAALLSRVFSRAIKTKAWKGDNPAKGLERFPEQSRERFLRPNEMPRFLAAVGAEQSPWREYFSMLLYTGQRLSAVCSMRWQDVDLDSGVWHVPSWASKNGKPLSIALTGEAVDLLSGMDRGEGLWVFPSDLSESGHITTPRKAWLRVCKHAELNDLNIHDVRRTVGSWLAASGANAFVISKALGHIDPRSAQVYARLDTEPVRDALSGVIGSMTGVKQ